MIEFANPYWFSALPLPYFIHRFIPAFQTKQFAYKVPFFDILVDVLGLQANKGATRLVATHWQRISLFVGWLLIVMSMAKPMWLGEPQTRELIGRDLMIVVDLSGSMAKNDFIAQDGEKISRLAAVKNVLANFSEQRKKDRLGLILFGDEAVLQAPFTSDHQAWNELLKQTQVGMAGKGTHLGDAIGLAIKTFKEEESQIEKEKVMIVLTDGNDTQSMVPPLIAAKVADSYGIRIHMIAMGDPKTTGENALAMDVIENVAKKTGGRAFLAMSPSELAQVYRSVSELEPDLFESFTFQPKSSLHYVPLLFLLLNCLVMYSFYTLRAWRVEKRARRMVEGRCA